MNIEIIRYDGGIRIHPFPMYLGKFLKYSHRGMKTVGYAREVRNETRLLYVLDEYGAAFTLQGFYSEILHLISKNMDVAQVDDRRTPMPEPDWNAVKKIKLRDYQKEPVLDLLFKGMETSGVINAAGGFGKTHIQAITYAAWNSLNTILAIPIKQVVLQTYKKFKSWFPDKHIGLMADGINDISKDITICTFQGLRNCSLEKCQLLLVDEMQSAGQPGFQAALNQMRPIRMFGFSATTEGIFNNTDKLIKGMFGDDLILFPYEEAEEAGAVVPVFVYMVKMPDNLFIENYTKFDSKMRHGIQKCEKRNKIIGEVCSLIPQDWQAIIFVNKVVDHLIPLLKYMGEDVKYLHRESSKEKAGLYALTPKEQKKVIKEFGDNEFSKLIATNAFRAGVDIPNCRCVVQCASGSSKVEIIQEALRASRILTPEQMEEFNLPPKTHAVVVDFLDTHDSALEGMSRKRMDYYREQGWSVQVVEDPKDIDWNCGYGNTQQPSMA